MKQTIEQSEKAFTPEDLFADRMKDVPKSFIREILKVAISPDIISFAGGLPNRELFPVQELKESAIKVFDQLGSDALQYSNSEGYLPLREYISTYYAEKHRIFIKPENILITSGSQQGLDLLGKVLLNCNDEVVIEEPGYLGAIQALSLYSPRFIPVKLNNKGMDTNELAKIFHKTHPKLLYVVPEFQNPSGTSYSLEVRNRIAEITEDKSLYIVEDNPYIDLRFEGTGSGSFNHLLSGKTILLGTFSKTIVPGFRIGWVAAPDELMDKLKVAKQAADLHTNVFSQMVLHRYLTEFDNEEHIRKIISAYSVQCKTMVQAIDKYFPSDIEFTPPQGGMFLWVKLPDHLSSRDLFQIAIKKNVAIVPGDPFYTDGRKSYSTFRMNFSCSDVVTIKEGIAKIGESIGELKY
jgi:2-aminoadipate transaminase